MVPLYFRLDVYGLCRPYCGPLADACQESSQDDAVYLGHIMHLQV